MSGFTLRRGLDEAVAYRHGSYIRGSEFLWKIEGLRVELQGRAEHTWGLFMEDSYNFTVSLIALLISHKSAVILPNVQSGFLNRVKGHLDGLLTDRDGVATPLPLLQCDEIPDPKQPQSVAEYDLPNGKIALFTSGSTGEPKLIQKHFSFLLDECQVLEGLWGKTVLDSVILSTVTHQHIYGLLFRIVWPIVSGRCFVAMTDKDPETFIERSMKLPRVTLVSSPAYLKRMAESVDLRPIAPRVAMVFSSGGPLSSYAALKIGRQLGQGVREIYGSTETGGIAHRSQTDPDADAAWTPLPAVEVRTNPDDRCLIIASPFEGSGGWYSTADTAELHNDGTFHLTGRADQIVKVEEKRLSLTEMEQQLSAVELVHEAGATVQVTSRESVVVAVVLSAQGRQFLDEHGEWQLRRYLRRHLLQYFEPVLLPRKWRFVDSLPLNPQGKLLRDALLRLFAPTSDQRLTHPKIEKTWCAQAAATLNLFIPADLVYFNGHFPGQPILPGVVQVDWAIAYARQYLNVPETFHRMEAVKFNAFISPDSSVELKLDYDPTKKTLRFIYISGSRTLSSGRIILGDVQ